MAWDGSASKYTDAEYAAACVLDRAKCSADWKDKPAKQRYSLPIKAPGADKPSAEGVHAAAQRIGSVKACDAAVSAAKAKLRSAYKQLGEEPPDSIAARGVVATIGSGWTGW